MRKGFNPTDVPKDFEEVKQKCLEFYGGLKEIRCPYLETGVVFNAKGKEHLLFNGKNKARPRHDQYMRLKLLKYAPQVIKDSRTLQGYSHRKVFEMTRSNHRNEYVLVDAIFYEFIAILEKRIRVRVIVKKVGTAPAYFWSVIPFWKRDQEHQRNNMYYGNPEED